MARVRYSKTEAQAEATRRADAFVAERSDRDHWRYVNTTPDGIAPPRRSSKLPVVWVAMFAPIPPEGGVIDGDELFVVVDLELGTVSVRNW